MNQPRDLNAARKYMGSDTKDHKNMKQSWLEDLTSDLRDSKTKHKGLPTEPQTMREVHQISELCHNDPQSQNKKQHKPQECHKTMRFFNEGPEASQSKRSKIEQARALGPIKPIRLHTDDI